MNPNAAHADRQARRIEARASEVFAAIAHPARLAHWFGPAGFRNTIHAIDLRAGGPWRHTMHLPDGRDYENESRILRCEPCRGGCPHAA